MAALNNNTNVMSSHKTIALKVPKRQVPQLRFKEFDEEWNKYKIGKVFQLKAGGDIDKNHVSDIQSDKFKYPIYANAEKNKGFYGYSDIFKFDSGTITVAGRGVNIGIAHARNHKFYPIVRLLVLKPIKEKKLDIYFCEYVINNLNLFIESTGVPQLTAPQLSGYKINLPSLPEQQKIAQFLTEVDSKLQQLNQKKELLEQYKKGVMQQLFSQQLRFKKDDGSDYPDWEKKKLKEVLYEHKTKNKEGLVKEVFSVAKEKGVINQIEHLGRSFAADSTLHYKIAFPGDIIYTKSPTKDFPFGIIKQNLTGRSGLVSPLYVVTKPKTDNLGFLLHNYFLSWVNVFNYLVPLVQKGAKNTMNINNDDFLNGAKFILPVSKEEQQKIANYLRAIDTKIETVTQQIEGTQQFKKGLLQQMFV